MSFADFAHSLHEAGIVDIYTNTADVREIYLETLRLQMMPQDVDNASLTRGLYMEALIRSALKFYIGRKRRGIAIETEPQAVESLLEDVRKQENGRKTNPFKVHFVEKVCVTNFCRDRFT